MDLKRKIFAFAFSLILIFSSGCTANLTKMTETASVEVSSNIPDSLIPLGITAGIKIFCDGVMVVGFADVDSNAGVVSPGRISGVRENDMITAIGGKSVLSIEDVMDIMDAHKGGNLSLSLIRGSSQKTIEIAPLESRSGGYKLGLMIRDSAAGIGTLTYLDPKTMNFGGLGHGIMDIDTGQIVAIGKGSAGNVSITEIKKGYKGEPGEIQGIFLEDREIIGDLYMNSDTGVYGTMKDDSLLLNNQSVATSRNNEIKEGKAEILTNILSNDIETFEIEIEKVYNYSQKDTKNMLIRITDERLLSRTGGIIQGMSGSPIIQDGKLVGAVTHVLVNDPQRGYGVFIDNMFKNSMQKHLPAMAA